MYSATATVGNSLGVQDDKEGIKFIHLSYYLQPNLKTSLFRHIMPYQLN